MSITVETLGLINRQGRQFLLEIGRRGAAVSGDPREIVYFFYRFSICTKRFNAVAFRDTFTPRTKNFIRDGLAFKWRSRNSEITITTTVI